MTVVGDEPTAEPQPPERPWRGVRVSGGDLRIKDLSFKINDDGTITSNPVTVELRTEMWPYWLEEAIEAAVAANDAAGRIAEIVARLDAAEDQTTKQSIDNELSAVMAKELRSSMRATSACAFAIDGFYAAVKVRSPRHPQQDAWNKKKTSRHAQVTETIRHHLKIKKPAQARALKERVSATFKWRDWAVHPGSNYREPVLREDISSSVDWQFRAFSALNATAAVGMTIALFDGLVEFLPNGSEELARTYGFARLRMDLILDEYESPSCLPAFPRVESVKRARVEDTTSTDVSEEI